MMVLCLGFFPVESNFYPWYVQLYVGEAGLAAASPVPLEGRFEESTRSRVAVCLVGGARAFELTGKTLMKYVLNAYNDTDVFLHSPLDKDSHKFSLLSGASGLASARVFIPKQLPESRLQREVLTAANSPNGIQVCHLKRGHICNS